jgi:hypothetical protein
MMDRKEHQDTLEELSSALENRGHPLARNSLLDTSRMLEI